MSFQNIFLKKNIINSIIAFIPISYVAGNLLFNLNILFIIIIPIFFFGLDIIRFKYNIIDKLILILFCYICVNGFFNNFYNFDFPNAPNQNVILIKSILFLRFLVLYFIIRYLVINELINYKIIFYTFGLVVSFVSLDLIFQFFNGKNLFGLSGGDGRRLSGIFGDELIAGGYIQRFFIFLPFAVLIFSEIKNPIILKIIFFLLISISLFAILVSGNRMPLILALITLGLIFFYEIKLRKLLIAFFALSVLSFTFLLKNNESVYNHFHNFKDRSVEVLDYFEKRTSTSGKIGNLSNVWVKEFETGVLTWQQNKIFGGGIKSFFFQCSIIDQEFFVKNIGSCNSHPHNYYLEIASSLGLIGLSILILIFSLILIKSIKFVHFSKNTLERNIFIPFFIIFIIEIFPLKTTGSFFTSMTGNFLFIIIAFVVGLIDFKKQKN